MEIVIDWETYYGKDFSIKKLGVLQYVRDPRFKIHGLGLKIDSNPTQWITNEIEGILRSIDWQNVTLIGHNLYFDATILFEQFGIIPKRRIDTMSIAKGLFPSDESASLNNVALKLGLGEKIKGSLEATKDIVDLPDNLLKELGTYCIQDVELTREIYDLLIPAMPEKELDVIDLTLRMSTAPCLEINKNLAIRAGFEAEVHRDKAIRESKYTLKELASNVKFAQILTENNVTIPKKISKTTNKEIPALGQNDPEFLKVMDSHPELKPLWEGRAAAKSPLNITRAAKWVYIATHGSKKMPMPLNYYGAHTGRWSGMDGINVQNLPRKGLLRKAIIAPKDHVILVADSAQIELRVNAWFAGQEDLLEALRNKEDVYILEAAEQFKIDPKDVTAEQRQFGKIVILGCGYGMGAKKFQDFCASGPLGMKPIHLTLDKCYETINAYRKKNFKIVEMWKTLDQSLEILMDESGDNWKGLDQPLKCVRLQERRIKLPNQMKLLYEGLRTVIDPRDPERTLYFYGNNRPIWGGTLDENIIQALARIIISDQMLETDKLDGVDVVGCTHDEIIGLCHKDVAEQRFKEIIQIMSTPPLWAKDLPLGAEGGWAENYSK